MISISLALHMAKIQIGQHGVDIMLPFGGKKKVAAFYMITLARYLLSLAFALSLVEHTPLEAQQDSLAAPTILRMTIDSAIGPVTVEYLDSVMVQAKSLKAAAIVIELDTPGGLMESTRKMVETILSSSIPVIVYVSPSGARAGSAGVFLTLASHLAVMAPTTHIGAAHPVGLFGGDVEGDMKTKIENDAAAWARTLAQTHGRNAEFAERAVRESISFSSEEALKSKVINFIAQDLNQLLEKADGRQLSVLGATTVLQLRGAKIVDAEMTSRQKVVSFLSDPNLIYLLLIIGLLGVFIEFQFPGLVLPGLIGAISLIIVFGVQVLPVNWFGAIMILAGIALLIAEIYVTSLGLLTLGGLGLFVLGSFLLFDVPGSMIQVEPVMIWIFAVFVGLVFALFGFLIARTLRQGATSSIDAMKGERVRVREPIKPGSHGLVKLQGSFWKAYCDEEIAEGEEVIVDRVVGTKVFVKRIDEKGK